MKNDELFFDEDLTDDSSENNVVEDTEKSSEEVENIEESSEKAEIGVESSNTEEPVVTKPSAREERLKREKVKGLKIPNIKHKKALAIGLGVIVVGCICYFIFRPKETYFDDVNKVTSATLGTYQYVLDVRTSEHKDVKVKASDVTKSDLSNLKSAEDTESTEQETDIAKQKESEGGKHNRSISDSWTNKDNILATDWKYPNYKLVIDEQTTSLKPYTCYYKVSLVTEYFNDVLTEVYCIDGNYYINIEQLRYWLRQSKDSYFLDLGNNLPDGSKWLVIPQKEFNYASRYAESNEKSGTSSIYRIDRKVNAIISIIFNQVNAYSDKGSLSSQGTTKYFSLKNPDNVVKGIKTMVENSGNTYSDYLSSVKDCVDDMEQAENERDNVIAAFSNLVLDFNNIKAKDVNLDMQGMTRNYNDSEGNPVTEVVMNTAFTSGVTDFRINFFMSHSDALPDIKIPLGSTISIKDYANPELISDTINSIIDYLNFTDIKTEVQLDMTPENAQKQLDEKVVDMINETGLVYATKHNLPEIIKNYTKYDKNDKLKEIIEFYNKESVEETKTIENIVSSRSTSLSGTLENSLTYTVAINNTETNDKLFVLDLNVSGGNVKTNDFNLISSDGNIYPCNNTDVLLSYNENFDTFDAVDETNAHARLYFVIDKTNTNISLQYKDKILGDLTR